MYLASRRHGNETVEATLHAELTASLAGFLAPEHA
jgi:hypothetical protein